MTEGNVRVRTNERTEVNSVTGSYCQVGKLRLYTVRLGDVRANGLETPGEGSSLDGRERLIRRGNAWDSIVPVQPGASPSQLVSGEARRSPSSPYSGY